MPQIQVPSADVISEPHTNVSTPSRRICFKEPGMGDELQPRLTRAPTPYPKDLQRYERSVNNMLRKNREAKSHSVNLNVDQNIPQIKEAKVMPMKPNIDVLSGEDSGDRANIVLENFDNCGPSHSEMTGMMSYRDSIVSSEGHHNEGDIVAEEMKKLPGPPPYHIAAIYSKNAQFFNNVTKNDVSEDMLEGGKLTSMDRPRHFIQDQPINILMPQPQHPHIYQHYMNDAHGYIAADTYGEQQEGRKKRESNWVFGNHKNPRILEVTLTPCCYVLGFTVKYNEMVCSKIHVFYSSVIVVSFF